MAIPVKRPPPPPPPPQQPEGSEDEGEDLAEGGREGVPAAALQAAGSTDHSAGSEEGAGPAQGRERAAWQRRDAAGGGQREQGPGGEQRQWRKKQWAPGDSRRQQPVRGRAPAGLACWRFCRPTYALHCGWLPHAAHNYRLFSRLFMRTVCRVQQGSPNPAKAAAEPLGFAPPPAQVTTAPAAARPEEPWWVRRLAAKLLHVLQRVDPYKPIPPALARQVLDIMPAPLTGMCGARGRVAGDVEGWGARVEWAGGVGGVGRGLLRGGT